MTRQRRFRVTLEMAVNEPDFLLERTREHVLSRPDLNSEAWLKQIAACEGNEDEQCMICLGWLLGGDGSDGWWLLSDAWEQLSDATPIVPGKPKQS